jgi:hypothetical protein
LEDGKMGGMEDKSVEARSMGRWEDGRNGGMEKGRGVEDGKIGGLDEKLVEERSGGKAEALSTFRDGCQHSSRPLRFSLSLPSLSAFTTTLPRFHASSLHASLLLFHAPTHL